MTVNAGMMALAASDLAASGVVSACMIQYFLDNLDENPDRMNHEPI
ncbi:hypothetical protein [Burkholderia sp. 3C]